MATTNGTASTDSRDDSSGSFEWLLNFSGCTSRACGAYGSEKEHQDLVENKTLAEIQEMYQEQHPVPEPAEISPRAVKERPARATTAPSALQRLGMSACCSPSSQPFRTKSDSGPAAEAPSISALKRPLPAPAPAPAPVPAPGRGQYEPVAKDSSIAMLSIPEVAGSATKLEGAWLLTNCTGEMDAFLGHMGRGEAERQIARGLNYGMGVQQLRLTQESDDLTLRFEKVGLPYDQQFVIGGGKQECEMVSGTSIIDPRWEGGALRMDFYDINGQDQCSRWLYFRDQKMVMESKHVRGSQIKQFYKPAPPDQKVP